MLSHKKIIPFPVSHIKLCTILMQTTFSFNFILCSSFFVTGLLSASHDSVSLPVVVLCGFWFFFSPSSDCRKFFYWRKGQRWGYFSSLEVILQKPISFPLLKISPCLFLNMHGNDQMRQLLPAVYSPASCSRTLAAGWPSQVSVQLGTKQHELLLHPLNIASCSSNIGTKPM